MIFLDYIRGLAVPLVSGAIASVSFGILFHVNKRHLHLVLISSAITYLIYYTVLFFSPDAFFTAALLSTMFTALYSEISARARRAPTIVFLIPGLIPTVPGAGLYNTMHHAISSEFNAALYHLGVTLQIALGIGGGILFVSVVFGMVLDSIKKHKARSTSPSAKSEK